MLNSEEHICYLRVLHSLNIAVDVVGRVESFQRIVGRNLIDEREFGTGIRSFKLLVNFTVLLSVVRILNFKPIARVARLFFFFELGLGVWDGLDSDFLRGGRLRLLLSRLLFLSNYLLDGSRCLFILSCCLNRRNCRFLAVRCLGSDNDITISARVLG